MISLKKLSVGLMLVLIWTLAAVSVFAQDGRINVHHHFGGDVLYCTTENGCWMLNLHGELLWEVPQADIQAAMDAACETRATQIIEAGEGTYGPVTLEINCFEGIDPYLTLKAQDEWGAQNAMQFSPNYTPVYPAPEISPEESGSSDRCAFNLEIDNFLSQDGIHFDEGFDIWLSGSDAKIFDGVASFLFWSPTSLGLQECIPETK